MLDPIIINEYAIVASGSGRIYALNVSDGQPIWSADAGEPIVAMDASGNKPLKGFGAGEGYLLVPAGNVLTAWHIGH